MNRRETGNCELHFGGPSVEVSFEDESESDSGSVQGLETASATVEDEEPNTQQQFDVCGARICSEQNVEENAVAQSKTIDIIENIQIVPPHTLDLLEMQPPSHTAKASHTKRLQFRTKLIVESYDELIDCDKKIREIDILLSVMAMITKVDYHSQIDAPTIPSKMTEFLRSLQPAVLPVENYDYANLDEKMQELDALVIEHNEVLKRQIKHIQYFVNKIAKIGWHSTKWIIGAGINNIGNTCFVNATLQVLFHISVLADYMLNNQFHPSECNEECASEMLFCKLIQLLHKSRLGEQNIRPYGFSETAQGILLKLVYLNSTSLPQLTYEKTRDVNLQFYLKFVQPHRESLTCILIRAEVYR
ncbi:uncharacterized protein LOC119072004 [Bradysia coprophila]|uniref:uncharacterized protein LOC119072004 n=1 Tax=Bradysia coprophila TaxID=38358 RepID=UPI00187DBCBF|nr:uncharacterized protein LOC119072004 [Bradysia coprophila]